MKSWVKGGLIGAVIGAILWLIAMVSNSLDLFTVCDPSKLDMPGYVCLSPITEVIGVFSTFINPLAWIGYGAVGTPAHVFFMILTGIIFLFIYGAILGLIYDKKKIAFGIILGILLGFILGIVLTALFGDYVKQTFLIVTPIIGAVIGWLIFKRKK